MEDAWLGQVARGYGPHGALSLVAEDDLRLVKGASVLLEARTQPGARPFVDLARRVSSQGEGATTAVLLAADLVRRAVQGRAHRRAYLDGYRLARRQALAVLDAVWQDATAAQALATSPYAALILEGLGHGPVDLDAVDIRTEPDAVPGWADGLFVTARAAPPGPLHDARVLICGRMAPARPRLEGVTGRGSQVAWAQAQDAAQDALLAHLDALGVGVVVVAGPVPDEVADRLAGRVLVVADAPRDLVLRLAPATGADPVHDARDAGAGELGRADACRHREGWTLSGPGPSATLSLQAQTPWAAAAVRSDAERTLRTVGQVLQHPGVVPGGGRWQRQVAASLRGAADAAPGHTPLAMRAAADALDGLADRLVRNAGHDPSTRRVLDEVVDPAVCVRHAVTSAFATAEAVLRVDARHTKRPSSPQRLRGPGKVGSPKGMPGDIPPLM